MPMHVLVGQEIVLHRTTTQSEAANVFATLDSHLLQTTVHAMVCNCHHKLAAHYTCICGVVHFIIPCVHFVL